MTTIAHAVMQGLSNVTDDPKRRDLKHDIIDCTSESCLTTDYGIKVCDTDNWSVFPKSTILQRSLITFRRLKVSDGQRAGPSLLEDQIAREKIQRFDHERIPERVVHARGTGARGYFKVYDDRASKYTYAPVLTDPSRQTPIFIRFSTVQGSRGSAVSLLPLCYYWHPCIF